MKKLLIKNGYIITMDEKYNVFPCGHLVIEGEIITKITNTLPKEEFDEVFDAQGYLVLPGFVNTHVHTSQQLGRGLGDDVSLLTWLFDRIWPYESAMDEHSSYISTLLCCLELIKSGVTTFAEAGGQHVDGMGRALREIGIKGILARSVMDMGEGLPSLWQESTDELIAHQVELFDRWHNQANKRIKVWFGLRTIFNNSRDLIVRTKEAADKYGVGVHMHVAEIPEEIQQAKERTGYSTVRFLEEIGVLDENFLAVHCVWMEDEELDIFARRGVKVSHNPAAAMRVLGFPKIPEMLDRGIVVGIGTDGAPSNNRMNIVDEMWLTSLIHKGRLHDPTVMPAEQIVSMATIKGAQALHWEKEIGSLQTGKKADIIFINPDTPGMLPLHDPVANLVTSMHSDTIRHMLCNGNWIMKDRNVLTVTEEEILQEAKEVAENIQKKMGYQPMDRFARLRDAD